MSRENKQRWSYIVNNWWIGKICQQLKNNLCFHPTNKQPWELDKKSPFKYLTLTKFLSFQCDEMNYYELLLSYNQSVEKQWHIQKIKI